MKSGKLNLFDLTMIVVGLVIGMGIFRTSKDAAEAALTPFIFFSAWIAGGLVALCGALTYAEIGSRYPVTGGYYKIFSYAYHPSIGFAVNCVILISNAASTAGVALIGSEYLYSALFPGGHSNFVIAAIAMGIIALFYGINLMGLRMSSRTQNLLMIIKIIMLLVLISSLFFPSLYDHTPPLVEPKEEGFVTILLSFGVAFKATSFTYGGYQQTINFGEEVEYPRKNIPGGIFIGILMIICLYLAVSYAYYKVIGFETLRTSTGIASIVAEKMFGSTGRYVSSLLMFIAVLAYVNVLLLSNPRVMFAMSEDGILPRAFRKKDRQKDVLTVSLTAFAAACIIVLFFADTFEKILSFSIFLDSIGMATSAATIFVLRKRTKHLDGTGIYSMKLYPLMPILFVAAYAFLAVIITITNPVYAVIGTAVFTAFMIIYFVAEKVGRKELK